MRAVLTLAAVAVLAAAGSASARRDREVPAATPVGEALSCIPLTSIRSSKVRSDKVIDFEMRGGKVYRNELPYECNSLAFEDSFSYKTSLSQLCSSDIITVLRTSSGSLNGPSCGLGKFQRVEIAKR